MHRHFEPMPAGLSQRLCWSLHWLHSTKSCCGTLGSPWHFIKPSFWSLSVRVLTSGIMGGAGRPKLDERGVQLKLRCCWNPTADHLLALFSGIGYATQIVIAYAAVSYIVIQAWAFFYLFSSFTAEVPWASCRNSWNTGARANQSFHLQDLWLGRNWVQQYCNGCFIDWLFPCFFSALCWVWQKKTAHPTWRCLWMPPRQPLSSGSEYNSLFYCNIPDRKGNYSIKLLHCLCSRKTCKDGT